MTSVQIDAEKKELFEDAPVRKAIMTLAVPTIISQLVILAYNLADAWFIGRTGNPLMIAAIALVFPIFSLCTGIGNLFGIGGGSLISRLMGKGELDRAGKVSAFSIYAALATAAVYSVVAWMFHEKLLSALGASEATLPFARNYLFYVVTIGGVPAVMSMTLSHLLRSAGYAAEAGFGLSMGAALNIVFDPIFMFVLLPEGKEVIGAATATMLSNVIALAYFCYTLTKLSKSSVLCISPRKVLLDWKGISSVLSVGLPSGITIFLFDFASVVQNAAMAAHGDFQMAAMGIVLKAERLPIAVGLGLCQGSMPLVSYNYTAGNYDRMRACINSSRLYGIIVALISITLYQIFAQPLIRAFISISHGATIGALETLAFGVSFLRVRTCGTLFTFINFHITYMLQALGFGRLTLFISVLRLGVFFVSMVFILDRLFGTMGVVGSQWSAEILTIACAMPLFIRATEVNNKD